MAYTNRDLAFDVFDGQLSVDQLRKACALYGVTTGSKGQMEQRLMAKLRSIPSDDPALYMPGNDDSVITSRTPPVTTEPLIHQPGETHEWFCSKMHRNSAEANFCMTCGEPREATESIRRLEVGRHKAHREIDEAFNQPLPEVIPEVEKTISQMKGDAHRNIDQITDAGQQRITEIRQPPPEERPAVTLSEGEQFNEFLEGMTFGLWKRRKR